MKLRFALLVTCVAFLGGLALHAQPQKPVVPATTVSDPYAWLEDVNGEKAMAWVRARNAESAKELESGKTFTTLQTDIGQLIGTLQYMSPERPRHYDPPLNAGTSPAR